MVKVKKMSVDELCGKLSDMSDLSLEDAIQILRDQKINGKMFLKLEVTDFSNMTIKYGDAMTLIDLRSRLTTKDTPSKSKETEADATPEILNSETEPAPTETPEKTSAKKQQQQQAPSLDESVSDEKDEVAEKYDVIRPFFSTKEFNDLSQYDKDSYLSLVNNYERMCIAMAPKVPNKPPFMLRKVNQTPSRQSKKANNEENESESDKENEPGNSKKTGPVKSKQSAGENSRGKSKRVKVSTDDKQKKKKKPKLSFRACYGPNDMAEDEYLANLTEYDIDEILKDAGHKLKATRTQLKSNGIVFDKERKLMVRTLTKYLFYESVDSPSDIKALHKEGLAASIIQRYPSFKDESDSSKYSWFRFFSRKDNSGFIANATQNIYRQMDETERRRYGQGKKSSVVNDDDDNNDDTEYDSEQYKYLALMIPSKSNKNEILQGMETSFNVRRGWIQKENPSITDILTDFPHFMSYDGEVLEEEFCRMHPDSNSIFIKDFPGLIQKLKSLVKNELEHVEEIDHEEIQACFTLSKLLPRPNYQRRRNPSVSLTPSLETLMVPLIRGTDPRKFIQDKKKASKEPVQPYLLSSLENRRVTRMFIAVDGQIIQLNSTSVLRGLDVLFKSYFVFNVNYPSAWLPMFEFIEKCVYKIDVRGISNSIAELKKKIDLVNL